MTIRETLILTFTVLMTALWMGCGSEANKTTNTTPPPAPKVEPAAPEPPAEDGVTTLVINGNDQMKFDKPELKAKLALR